MDIDLTVPQNPSPSNGSTIIDTTPLLGWEVMASATGYHIEVNTDSGFTGTVIADDDTLTASPSEYPITGVLSDNTTYYWHVKIKNEDGVWGDWSNTWSFTIDIAPPTTPSPSNGSTIIDTTPLLGWEDVSGATGYHIQVNTDSGFTGTVIADDNTLTASPSEYPITGALSDNTTCYWHVKIKNEDGVWGDWSSTWSFTIDIPSPTTPSPSNGSKIIDTTPLLDWEDVASSTGYHIEVNTNNSFTGTVIANNDTLTVSQYPITATLSDNTTYYWHVKIKNEDGVWGDWSSTWAFTVVNYFSFNYGTDLGWDAASSIQITTDTGFILAGSSASFNTGGVTGKHDWWIVKLDLIGNIIWQKAYGGTGNEYVRSIQETSDGGFIVAGQTESFGAGYYDWWIMKLNSVGTIVWQKTYGGSDGDDYACSIQEISGGGFIVAGSISSGGGQLDAWIIKLNSDGTIVWQKTYGGSKFKSIQETSDGNFIVTGDNNSVYWIMKLNSDGTIVWTKQYGGNDWEFSRSIKETIDGGFIVAGSTDSFGAGSDDCWIMKLNSVGTIVWQKAYGGTYGDYAHSIQETSDGGFIVAGYSDSFRDGGAYEIAWILKLYSNGNVEWQKKYRMAIGDLSIAESICETQDGGFIVGGHSWFSGPADHDLWLMKLNSDGTCPPLDSNTSITPVDTTAALFTFTVTETNTNATETNTNANVTDTDAEITQQAP